MNNNFKKIEVKNMEELKRMLSEINNSKKDAIIDLKITDAISDIYMELLGSADIKILDRALNDLTESSKKLFNDNIKNNEEISKYAEKYNIKKSSAMVLILLRTALIISSNNYILEKKEEVKTKKQEIEELKDKIPEEFLNVLMEHYK